MKCFLCLTLSTLCFSSFAQGHSSELPFQFSASDFGGVGLIQTPNARFTPSGHVNFGSTYHQDYWHFTLSMQFTDWLESTLRYTIINDVLYSTNPKYSGDTRFTDKGIEFKFRLLKETQWRPEIALGIRDFGGSGVFDGEYLVLSKQWKNIDFTMGLGWGYLGNRGNLYAPSHGIDKCQRRNSYNKQGGELEAHRWFSGCLSWFAGIQYQTPIKGLQFKLEYEGNDYRNDRPVLKKVDNMTQSTPWNVGLHYQFAPWGDVRLSYQRGNTLTIGVNLMTNFNQMHPTWLETSTQTEAISHSMAHITVPQWQHTRDSLSQTTGVKIHSLHYDHKTKHLTLAGQQTHYRNQTQAHQKLAEQLNQHLTGIDKVAFIDSPNGFELQKNEWETAQWKKYQQGEDIEQSWQNTVTQNDILWQKTPHWTEKNNWNANISPNFQQSLGGAETFYFFHAGLNSHAYYAFAPNWVIDGSIYLNLLDNYNEFRYDVPPDGTQIPRVRTLIRQYLKNRGQISRLQLTHYQQWGKNWFQSLYGGYLESMFAGVGSEILYRPWQKNWAMSLDLNYVKQRDPRSLLGLYQQRWHRDGITQRDYQIQTHAITGHLTAYYQPKWSWINNLLITASAGRYLAGDMGITLDVAKQFTTGVIVGAYATFTNLSAKEYGEGSYTKGIYLSIPFDLITIRPSTQRAKLSWTPLTRDGGQKLARSPSLFSLTDVRYPWYTRPPKENYDTNGNKISGN
jgi:hypothetical protein